MQAHKDPIASYLLRNTQKIVLIYFHVIIFALVLWKIFIYFSNGDYSLSICRNLRELSVYLLVIKYSALH